jgi:hypothetical protein
VGDRAAERALRGADRIDMDELMIVSRIGKGLSIISWSTTIQSERPVSVPISARTSRAKFP